MKPLRFIGRLAMVSILLLLPTAHGEYELRSGACGDAGPHVSAGGNYRMAAVIGQPAPITASGTNLVMRGGFPGVLLPDQPTPLPRITPQLQETGLALTWEVVGEPFSLQESPAVGDPAVWRDRTEMAVHTNGCLRITLPLDAESHFFRLRSLD